MMPELLPAFNGTVFPAAHVFGRAAGQAAVLGSTASGGAAMFVFCLHF